MANNKPEWTNYIPYADGDSLDDVKKAYKSLAKSMHPDSGDGNEEKIRKLNKAWEDAQKWFKSETAEKKEDKKTNTKDFIKNKEKELKLKELKLNYFCDELSDDEIKSSILYDVNKKGNAPKDFEQNFKINTIKKCDVYIFKYIGNFDVSMSLTHGVLDDVLYKHAYNEYLYRQQEQKEKELLLNSLKKPKESRVYLPKIDEPSRSNYYRYYDGDDFFSDSSTLETIIKTTDSLKDFEVSINFNFDYKKLEKFDDNSNILDSILTKNVLNDLKNHIVEMAKEKGFLYLKNKYDYIKNITKFDVDYSMISLEVNVYPYYEVSYSYKDKQYFYVLQSNKNGYINGTSPTLISEFKDNTLNFLFKVFSFSVFFKVFSSIVSLLLILSVITLILGAIFGIL